jgi:hypothetical protein
METDRETRERDVTDLFLRKPDPLVGSTVEHAKVRKARSISNLAIWHVCTDLGSALLQQRLLGVSHAEPDRMSNIRRSNTLILVASCSRFRTAGMLLATKRIHIRVGVLISLKDEYRLRPYLKSTTRSSETSYRTVVRKT